MVGLGGKARGLFTIPLLEVGFVQTLQCVPQTPAGLITAQRVLYTSGKIPRDREPG